MRFDDPNVICRHILTHLTSVYKEHPFGIALFLEKLIYIEGESNYEN